MTVRQKCEHKTCKDCAFYNDCPMDYECPAVETLRTIMEKEGAIFTVYHGTLIGIASPMEKDEE